MLTPLQKAQQLYRDAYMRWGLELSHDKNVLIAKSIAEYVCKEVLGHMGADRGTQFWEEVLHLIKTSSHDTLYNPKKMIVKFNGGLGCILCSGCRKIIKIGKNFTEEEWKHFRGELEQPLPPQYCEKCSQNSTISTEI